MKIGTDAVLLGAWADVCRAKSVLDIGTGCGILALMVAQRNSSAAITAVEIDQGAAEEAADNARNSKWSGRIEVVRADIREFSHELKFEAIISNPPFFQSGKPSPESKRAEARHAQTFTRQVLAETVVSHLSDRGAFFTILPHEGHDSFVEICKKMKLNVNQLVEVYPNKNKPAHRVLLAMSLEHKTYRSESLYLHNIDERGYSDELLDLTKDFYLYI
jgi:tRNA1Val (adenine37-N6)-methyltransferase